MDALTSAREQYWLKYLGTYLALQDEKTRGMVLRSWAVAGADVDVDEELERVYEEHLTELLDFVFPSLPASTPSQDKDTARDSTSRKEEEADLYSYLSNLSTQSTTLSTSLLSHRTALLSLSSPTSSFNLRLPPLAPLITHFQLLTSTLSTSSLKHQLLVLQSLHSLDSTLSSETSITNSYSVHLESQVRQLRTELKKYEEWDDEEMVLVREWGRLEREEEELREEIKALKFEGRLFGRLK